MGQSDFPGSEPAPEPHSANRPIQSSPAQPGQSDADRSTASRDQPRQSPEELQEEDRKIRRFQMMVNMVMQVIAQDATLTVEQAAEMVSDTRRAALALFPDKELAFNLIYWPRLQRLMRERYRMQ